jgi:hypothetical protein
MSAGGQNSTSFSRITGMRIRDSSDIVEQLRVRQIYQMFNPTTPNAVRPRITNDNGLYLQFLEGTKEVSSNVNGYSSCTSCAGLSYNGNRVVLTFRN